MGPRHTESHNIYASIYNVSVEFNKHLSARLAATEAQTDRGHAKSSPDTWKKDLLRLIMVARGGRGFVIYSEYPLDNPI